MSTLKFDLLSHAKMSLCLFCVQQLIPSCSHSAPLPPLRRWFFSVGNYFSFIVESWIFVWIELLASPAKPRPYYCWMFFISYYFYAAFSSNLLDICQVCVQFAPTVKIVRLGNGNSSTDFVTEVRAAGNVGTNAISCIALCLLHPSSIIQTSCQLSGA